MQGMHTMQCRNVSNDDAANIPRSRRKLSSKLSTDCPARICCCSLSRSAAVDAVCSMAEPGEPARLATRCECAPCWMCTETADFANAVAKPVEHSTNTTKHYTRRK